MDQVCHSYCLAIDIAMPIGKSYLYSKGPEGQPYTPKYNEVIKLQYSFSG